MRQIGILSTAYLDRYGLYEGAQKLKEHGYDCIDYQGFMHTEDPLFGFSAADFEKELRTIRSACEDAGVGISQAHGPWRFPPEDATKEQRAERFEKMSRSILGTSILGCKNFVIHPLMPFGADKDPDPEQYWDINFEFMSRLADVGQKHGVMVCFENLPMTKLSLSRTADALRFVKSVNHPYLRMCLDVGHCAVFGESPADAARMLGKEYLRVMHVHDNDGKGDLHWLPYAGVIDWDAFAKSLDEIGFDGTVSLETLIPEKDRPEEEIALARMAKRIAGRDD